MKAITFVKEGARLIYNGKSVTVSQVIQSGWGLKGSYVVVVLGRFRSSKTVVLHEGDYLKKWRFEGINPKVPSNYLSIIVFLMVMYLYLHLFNPVLEQSLLEYTSGLKEKVLDWFS